MRFGALLYQYLNTIVPHWRLCSEAWAADEESTSHLIGTEVQRNYGGPVMVVPWDPDNAKQAAVLDEVDPEYLPLHRIVVVVDDREAAIPADLAGRLAPVAVLGWSERERLAGYVVCDSPDAPARSLSSRPGHDREHGASPFVLRSLAKIGRVGRGRALDVPCGYGRHTWPALDCGYDITAIDLASARTAYVRETASARGFGDRVTVETADVGDDIWDALGTFDLAIVTDWAKLDVLERLSPCISTGGFLVFETPSGRGDAWQGLPQAGSVLSVLTPSFAAIRYQERPAGPASVDAVTVKCLAQRRSCSAAT